MNGCLCIHGFTGSPFEVNPLAEFLGNHTDWKFVVPTLPGHGENGSLKGVRYTEWVDCAEQALQSLLEECETVFLIGFSMGGVIACYLAAKYPVKKLVLLSAAARYINPRQLVFDSMEMVKDAWNGKLRQNELYFRYKNKMLKTPITAAYQFRLLVAANRSVFREIRIPTFIAQGKDDGIVPPKSALFLFENISSPEKELRLVEKAKHLICHCEENKTLFCEILEFLLRSNAQSEPDWEKNNRNFFITHQ
ncbi:alpha/beta fold hydrolase [Peribacillus saganii]|uniref:Alpha/beta fold hydrolase n=1 Tax=Peribacillus saganii TaxID=2303992 RepID=A0A372LLR1_9BACI|nr:alpha/beta fold hydrolase [Peribacillus saganii]RFU67391.1 alpha/beta fold hydrolase [Peribacillus saganii]